VAHISPQGVNLGTRKPIVTEEDFLNLFGMVGGGSEPVQDGLFLDPLDPPYPAEAHSVGQHRQSFKDVLAGCPSAVEEGTFGDSKGLLTGLAIPTRGPGTIPTIVD
jgi:hypothetical protein